MTLVTHQTGPEGRIVKRLLVEEGADIRKELYVGMVVDRATQRVTLMASSEGGMDIEEVAASTPDKIYKVAIDPTAGLTDAQADDVARKIGVPEPSIPEARKFMQGLYRAFDECDASLAEINPSSLPATARCSLDAKLNFDSNALPHPRSSTCATSTRRIRPVEASSSIFRTSLNGSIGCLNGAGSRWQRWTPSSSSGQGGELPRRGRGPTEKVTEAFKLMLKNPAVKGILVNIFGGIMRCDTIAEGVIAAAKEVKLSVPLVAHERHQRRPGQQMLQASDCRSFPPTTWVTRRRRSSPRSLADRNQVTIILIGKDTKVMTQGITGKTGPSTPACAATTNGQNCFGRRESNKAGRASRVSDLRYREAKERPARRSRYLRAPPLLRRHRRAVDAELDCLVCITEGVPVRDMKRTRDRMRGRRSILSAPTVPASSPLTIKIGIMPGQIQRNAASSRARDTDHEAVGQLMERGWGQSTCVGIGGDPVNGLKHIDVMKMFNDD
jgi:succinyl-CoA synthetase beta subunit